MHYFQSCCFCFVLLGTFLPLMIDPHKVLDYQNWWNKSLNNIKPYIIPPLSAEIISKLNHQVDCSSDKIWRTRPAEEATKIIALLRELINSHTQEHSFKFSWGLSMYRNPPKKTNKVQPLVHIQMVSPAVFKKTLYFPTGRLGSTHLKKWQWLKMLRGTMLWSVPCALKFA